MVFSSKFVSAIHFGFVEETKKRGFRIAFVKDVSRHGSYLIKIFPVLSPHTALWYIGLMSTASVQIVYAEKLYHSDIQ